MPQPDAPIGDGLPVIERYILNLPQIVAREAEEQGLSLNDARRRFMSDVAGFVATPERVAKAIVDERRILDAYRAELRFTKEQYRKLRLGQIRESSDEAERLTRENRRLNLRIRDLERSLEAEDRGIEEERQGFLLDIDRLTKNLSDQQTVRRELERALREADAKLKEEQRKLAKCQSELNVAKQDYLRRSETERDLSERTKGLRRQLNESENEQKKCAAEIERLRRRLARSEEQLSESRARAKSANEALSRAETENESSRTSDRDRASELERQLAEARRRAAEIDAANERLIAENEQQARRIEYLQKELSDSQHIGMSQIGQLMDARAEMDQIRKTRDELTEQRRNSERTIEDLNKRLSECREQVARLEDLTGRLTRSGETDAARIESLRRELAETRASYDSRVERLTKALASDRVSSRRRIARVRAGLDEAERRRERVATARNRFLTQRLQNARKSMESCKNRTRLLEQELANARRQRDENARRADAAQKEYDETRSLLQTIGTRLWDVDSFVMNLDDIPDRLETVVRERNELRQRVFDLEEERNKASRDARDTETARIGTETALSNERERLARLNDELSAKQREIEALSETASRSRAESEALRDERDRLLDEQSLVTEERDRLQAILDEFQRASAEESAARESARETALRRQVDELNDAVSALEAERTELTGQLEEQGRALREIEEGSKARLAEYSRRVEELETDASRFEELQRTTEEAIVAKGVADTEISILTASIEGRDEQLRRLNEEIERLRRSARETGSDVDVPRSVDGRIEELRVTVNATNAELSEARSRLARLETELSERETLSSQLRERGERLESEIRTLRARSNESASRIDALTRRNEALDADLRNANDALTRCNETVASLRQQLSETAARRDRLLRELKIPRRDGSESEQFDRVLQLFRDQEELQTRLNEATVAREALERRCRESERAQREELMRARKALEDQYASYDGIIKEHQETIAKLRRQAASLDNELRETRERCENEKEEARNSLEGFATTASNDRDDLVAQIRRRDQEIADLKSQLNAKCEELSNVPLIQRQLLSTDAGLTAQVEAASRARVDELREEIEKHRRRLAKVRKRLRDSESRRKSNEKRLKDAALQQRLLENTITGLQSELKRERDVRLRRLQRQIHSEESSVQSTTDLLDELNVPKYGSGDAPKPTTSAFVDDQAIRSGSEMSEEDYYEDDPTLGGFIVSDTHETEESADSSSSSDDDSSSGETAATTKEVSSKESDRERRLSDRIERMRQTEKSLRNEIASLEGRILESEESCRLLREQQKNLDDAKKELRDAKLLAEERAKRIEELEGSLNELMRGGDGSAQSQRVEDLRAENAKILRKIEAQTRRIQEDSAKLQESTALIANLRRENKRLLDQRTADSEAVGRLQRTILKIKEQLIPYLPRPETMNDDEFVVNLRNYLEMITATEKCGRTIVDLGKRLEDVTGYVLNVHERMRKLLNESNVTRDTIREPLTRMLRTLTLALPIEERRKVPEDFAKFDTIPPPVTVPSDAGPSRSTTPRRGSRREAPFPTPAKRSKRPVSEESTDAVGKRARSGGTASKSIRSSYVPSQSQLSPSSSIAEPARSRPAIASQSVWRPSDGARPIVRLVTGDELSSQKPFARTTTDDSKPRPASDETVELEQRYTPSRASSEDDGDEDL